MKSLESGATGQDDWVRESQETGRDRDLGNLERPCRTFDIELQAEELLGDEWVDEEEETTICADSHVFGSTDGGEDQICGNPQVFHHSGPDITGPKLFPFGFCR